MLLTLAAFFVSAQIPAAPGEAMVPFALKYIEISPGSGEAAAAGQRYKVHYTGWLRDGKLVAREHVVHGTVHDFPDTLLMLFDGANTGKLVLALAPQHRVNLGEQDLRGEGFLDE